jgi:threonine synthase
MKFYSTNNPGSATSLADAVLRGLAADGGLFMPQSIPVLPRELWQQFPSCSLGEIGYHIVHPFLVNDLPEHTIREICEKAINFNAPLVPIDDNNFVLELFHGPTLAFKDFGARFMARLMSYLVRGADRTLTILVATSGDTGSAVASGFYNTPGIQVILLYPSGMVSKLQEKQLTTMGGNITALEINGTFDDCQALVKQAFVDKDLQQQLWLSSANSINIARLLPQSFYYWYAWSRLPDPGQAPVFSVPSGNFGNLTAGLIAHRMGMPAKHFIAATNANKTFPDYMETGIFTPRPTIATLSNAMDVGNPSNFARIMDMFDEDIVRIRASVYSKPFNDDATLQAMARIYKATGYLLDPHGAVGYLGLADYRLKQTDPQPGIILETAHPGKFPDSVEKSCGFSIDLPAALAAVLEKEKNATPLSADFAEFKNFLINNV